MTLPDLQHLSRTTGRPLKTALELPVPAPPHYVGVPLDDNGDRWLWHYIPRARSLQPKRTWVVSVTAYPQASASSVKRDYRIHAATAQAASAKGIALCRRELKKGVHIKGWSLTVAPV